MKVILHKDRCIECGTCSQVAPKVFTIEGGRTKLIEPLDLEDQEIQDQARQAALLCPAQAIEVIENGED
jgi:ferredoxin